MWKDKPNEAILLALSSDSPKIRYELVKELGKYLDDRFADLFIRLALEDKNSLVRRESVSSLGRLRNKKYTVFLLRILKDQDPKVVLQAIRGLLVFKKDATVKEKLLELYNHKNEMIQEVIAKEFSVNRSSSKQQSHSQSPDLLQNLIVHGDVIDVMKYVEEESVHLTFTSPPYYNARDYSFYQSYEDYLSFLEKTFKEVHRITKEGRFLIVNTSPIIVPRVSRQHSSKRYPIPFDLHSILVKNGWEYIDDIIWVKPEASVKNRVGGFMQHRKPLGYKPNTVTEMLMVYRKKTDKLLDWNIRSYSSKVVNDSKVRGKFESSNIWKIDPVYSRNHSAVFPIELCDKIISYYSYKGDLVFDPFAGSGTLGISALKNGRKFFLTEKSAEYFDYMKKRFHSEQYQPTDDSLVRCMEIKDFERLKDDDNR